jgi:hypothetical protein
MCACPPLVPSAFSALGWLVTVPLVLQSGVLAKGKWAQTGQASGLTGCAPAAGFAHALHVEGAAEGVVEGGDGGLDLDDGELDGGQAEAATPISPPSGPSQWLFQGPPAESKFLAAPPSRKTDRSDMAW